MLNVASTLANSADTNEVLHFVSSHPSLHCLLLFYLSGIRLLLYCKLSKISNTYLTLFSTKIKITSALIQNMLAQEANCEGLHQTAQVV